MSIYYRINVTGCIMDKIVCIKFRNIFRSDYGPGDKLPGEKSLRQVGVSRGDIREVLMHFPPWSPSSGEEARTFIARFLRGSSR